MILVQNLQGDRCRHLDLAPDQRFAVAQLDPDGGDLVKAVEASAASARAHTASLPVWSFQFQAGTSVSQACRSMPELGVLDQRAQQAAGRPSASESRTDTLRNSRPRPHFGRRIYKKRDV